MINQVEPKPVLGTKVHQDQNKGTSMWDVMHPSGTEPKPSTSKTIHHKSHNPNKIHQRSSSGRRDPIGYFDDGKSNNVYGEPKTSKDYKPSWYNAYTPQEDYVAVAN